MALGEDRLRHPLMVLSEHDDGDIHALKRFAVGQLEKSVGWENGNRTEIE